MDRERLKAGYRPFLFFNQAPDHSQLKLVTCGSGWRSPEGLNKSAIARVKGIGWNTVARWLEKAAESCRRFNDRKTMGFADVSEQTGHSSIELTVKRYGHLQPGANRKFVNNLPGAKSAPQAHPALKASL